METRDVQSIIANSLASVGCILPTELEDFNLKDYIDDSLMFISAIVQIENDLAIELPDELLNYEAITSFKSFCIAISSYIEQQKSESN